MSGIILVIKAVLGSFGIAISISSLIEEISMGVVFGSIIVLISLAIPEPAKKNSVVEN